jgi:radical SAM protein with 4Fe4S-binding SPASM domain
MLTPSCITAWQVYRWGDATVCAVYDLQRNTFHLFEDDAGTILADLYRGSSADGIVQRIAASKGLECAKEVEAFLADWIPILFSDECNLPHEDMSTQREPYDGQDMLKEDSLENAFMIRCLDNQQMTVLNLELTYQCTQQCVHCYNPHHTKLGELDTEAWERVLRHGRILGVLRVCFTGGECTQHPGFWHLLSVARQLGMAVTIQSNGLYFDSPDTVSRLASYYPRSYEVSIYSHRPEIHDKITGLTGSWGRAMESLRLARMHNIPLAIKNPLMRDTWQDATKVAELARGMGAGLQTDVTITRRNDGDSAPLSYSITDDNALDWLFTRADLPLYAGTKRLALNSIPQKRDLDDSLCGAGGNGITVQPDGTVVPCASLVLSLGNVREASLAEIWHGAAMASWRSLRIRDNHTCAACPDLVCCSFCPGISLMECGSMLEPNSNDCRIAHSRRRTMLSMQR